MVNIAPSDRLLRISYGEEETEATLFLSLMDQFDAD